MYVKKATQTRATRERLERVGAKLFAERGFSAVSAEELVAAAKVTRGALYHHYDGKEGLFAAVLETRMKALHADLARHAAGARDPLDALGRGIRAFLDLSTEPTTQRILLVDGPAVLGWQVWREMDARYGLGLLKQAIAAAIAAGFLREQDPGMLAHLLLGALTEAAMVIARSNDAARARQAAELAIDAVIAGWRK